MAGSSLLVLIDDIASVLDDVATMTKVAGRKTAGVLGDDLAVNAESVTGVRADRELPVVWAVAKGSLVNKAILVPAALLLSVLAPWPIMMTTLAIIAGMVPVALGAGEGGDFRAPLGRAVIGGVITSTLLTLLVIPTVYEILHDGRTWLLGRLRRTRGRGGREPMHGPPRMRPGA